MGVESGSIKKLPNLANAEFLMAHYTRHVFEPHWHDTWAVGLVLKGAHDNSPRHDGSGIVAQGQVTLLEPGQLHAGHALGSESCQYLMLYLPDTLLNDVECWRQGPRSAIGSQGFQAPKLAKGLLAASRLEEACHPLECINAQTVWTELINDFVSEVTGSHGGVQARDVRSKSHAVERARQYLHDNLRHPFSLDQLANAAGVSKYHLCRLFSANFGMPPQLYLRQIRVQRARDLLRGTGTLSDIAFQAGFADQSHLGRAFKRVHGVTPGAYAAATR
ncbi:AraC family transcriptional regulator [Pseudomonas alliivorans]|nr:AraC family transcriptional regulator [Pseudomonas alliivorans]